MPLEKGQYHDEWRFALQALEWLRSTFLYMRIMHNPQHYGFKATGITDLENQLMSGISSHCDQQNLYSRGSCQLGAHIIYHTSTNAMS